jgi:hypothetical protein
MKAVAPMMALAVVLTGAAGCATHTNKNVSAGVVALTSGDQPRGYIEFFVLEKRKDSGVWIYNVEERKKPSLIGIAGIRSGGQFEGTPPNTTVPICETLHVAVTPGVHNFRLESTGRLLSVVVMPEMVTRVEIDREFVDKAVNYDVYRIAARVLLPVNTTAGMTASVEEK